MGSVHPMLTHDGVYMQMGFAAHSHMDYFERLKCSRRVFGLNTGAWNNGTRFRPSFIGFVG